MSDFELLKILQKELIDTLTERGKVKKHNFFPRTCCNAKIHRLRLQINEVMLRIERKLDSFYKDSEYEKWELRK